MPLDFLQCLLLKVDNTSFEEDIYVFHIAKASFIFSGNSLSRTQQRYFFNDLTDK
jgi:hypothetical protein